MKRSNLGANAVLLLLLILSSIINLTLGKKVQMQGRELDGQARKAAGVNVLGLKLASLDVSDLKGHPATLSFKDQPTPTLLYVFRSTCGWCAKNLSNVKELDRGLHANQRAQIIGLSLDDEKSSNEYVRSTQVKFPVYRGVQEKDVARLGLGGTPQTIMVSNGTITRNWLGAYNEEAVTEIQETFDVTLPGLK